MSQQYNLPIVLWSWGGRFSNTYIDRIKAMLGRHLHMPHHFVLISDDKKQREHYAALGDKTIPLWNDLRNMRGKCLVRLKAFHPSMADLIGPRFAWIDLDMVITDDVTPIFSRTEDFIISGVELRPQPYNGSLILMNAGCRSHVFDTFSMDRLVSERHRMNYGGSDQAWFAIALGDREATWTREDGLFSYRDDVAPRSTWNYAARLAKGRKPLPFEPTGGPMPKGCRIVQMNGPWNPDTPRVMQMSPWITENWR